MIVMKNILKLSFAALALTLLLASCGRDDTDKALEAKKSFETQTAYGIYTDGAYSFAYNDKDYQIAYNEGDRTVRLQKDDMSTYAIITLDSTPTNGATVQLSVQGKGVTAVKPTKMDVIKTTSDCVWVWDKASLTGYIFYWEF